MPPASAPHSRKRVQKISVKGVHKHAYRKTCNLQLVARGQQSKLAALNTDKSSHYGELADY